MAVEEVTIKRYRCSLCRTIYDTEQEAISCEARPVMQDRGVKIGDIVRVTRGDGAGQLAKVERIGVLDRTWGHYAWERYWHTVYLDAKMIDQWGSRLLTYDSYEPHQEVGA